MSRIARALHRYCIGRPCRVIPSGGAPYMIRVYLGHWRGWRLYLLRTREQAERRSPVASFRPLGVVPEPLALR